MIRSARLLLLPATVALIDALVAGDKARAEADLAVRFPEPFRPPPETDDVVGLFRSQLVGGTDFPPYLGYPDGRLGPDARGSGLTARELGVLELTARGLTAAATGRRLGCSPRTAQKHLDHVYRKLAVNDRVSAVIEAQYRGLIRPPRGPRDPRE